MIAIFTTENLVFEECIDRFDLDSVNHPQLDLFQNEDFIICMLGKWKTLASMGVSIFLKDFKKIDTCIYLGAGIGVWEDLLVGDVVQGTHVVELSQWENEKEENSISLSTQAHCTKYSGIIMSSEDISENLSKSDLFSKGGLIHSVESSSVSRICEAFHKDIFIFCALFEGQLPDEKDYEISQKEGVEKLIFCVGKILENY